MAGSEGRERRKKKHHHWSRVEGSHAKTESDSYQTTSNKFIVTKKRGDCRNSGRITPSEGSTKQRICMERKEISMGQLAVSKIEQITETRNDTEELRKRFNESLKKAINQLNYQLIKGETSEVDEEDEHSLNMQQKTVQQVVACTSRVLLHDQRIDPASVEIRMRVNNIKGDSLGRRANVHFHAFVAKGVDERGGRIIHGTMTAE